MAFAGRNLLVKIGPDGSEITLVGQTTGSLTVNREAIDITSKDDDGVRTLLSDLARFSVDISFEFVVKDSLIVDGLLDIGALSPGGSGGIFRYGVFIEGLGDITGNFQLLSGEITGEDGDGYIGASCTLSSVGAVTYTPEPEE